MAAFADLEEMRKAVRAFVDERDWQQFHAPKDLAVGLAVEAGELLENFQWKDSRAEELAKDAEAAARIRDEVADVVIYSVLLADALGFELGEAVAAKLEQNRQKYPIEKSRGRAEKYTAL